MTRQRFHSLFTAAFCILLHQPTCAAPQAPAQEKMPWQDPAYQMVIPATQATARPEAGVEEGWDLWMKHHKQRCNWVAEK